MKRKCRYPEKQPSILYQLVDESRADVIVNKFIQEIEEVGGTENEQTFISYEYEMNAFSVTPSEITKEDVEADIEKYLDYEAPKKLTEMEQLKADNEFLMQCIIEMSEVVYNG